MYYNRNLITAAEHATSTTEASGVFNLQAQAVLKTAGRWPSVFPFTVQYTISNTGAAFELRDSGTVNYVVEWGDGSSETVTTNNKSHTYASSGTYAVKLNTTGSYRPYYYLNGNEDQITAVLIDASANLGTNLFGAYAGANNMTSFSCPSSVTATVTNFQRAFWVCSSLTSFPVIDTSNGTNFERTWRQSGLTSFPSLDFSSATTFSAAWYSCSSLATIPSGLFDSTGTLAANAFSAAFSLCALTAQSIENILTSLDTNGASNITLSLNGGTNANASTWSYSAIDAYTDLINKGWTISQNGTPHIVYRINNSGTSFSLNSAGAINVDVDWGDGNTQTITSSTSHTYASAGIYEIKISINSGSYRPRFGSNATSDSQIISAVIANNGNVSSLEHAFNNASNLTTYKQVEGASSNATSLLKAFFSCSSLTSFPVIDTSNATNFLDTWKNCSSLTSFPSLDYSSATQIHYAWDGCSSLADFPANQFNSTGTLASFAFAASWRNCALTAQSIENILTSLDTNGAQNITLGINGGTNAAKTTWSTAANTAYSNLITKGWTITYNS